MKGQNNTADDSFLLFSPPLFSLHSLCPKSGDIGYIKILLIGGGAISKNC